MSDTLYQRFDRDRRGNGYPFKYVPAGEFRKVSWCQTHDAQTHSPSAIHCWVQGMLDAPIECVLVEVWMQQL